MSIYGVWVGGDSALAMVDTKAVDDEGRVGTSCKLLPLPAANTLVVHRGISLHFGVVLLHLLSSKQPHGSFDELGEVVPAALEELPQHFTEPALHGEAELELVLVGWSDRLAAMAVSTYRYKHGEPSQIGEPQTDAGVIVPIDPAELSQAQNLPFEGQGDRTEALRELAQRMIAFGRASDVAGELGFGGNMVVAQLSRNRMQIRDCGPIDPGR